MSAAIKLSHDELGAALKQLENWSLVDGKLHRELRFADFVQAFGFMTKVALEAERMGHHPEWFNVWNRVVIDLATHDAGNAVSNLDVELARRIDALA